MEPSRAVDLVVAAGPRQVHVLGTLVAATTASMEFDAHTVGDIRLAAEELARMLVARRPPTALKCEVSVDDWAATVTLSAAAHAGAPAPDPTGYRWHALTAITDSLGVLGSGSRSAGTAPCGRTGIRFSRRRVQGPTVVREPRPELDNPLPVAVGTTPS